MHRVSFSPSKKFDRCVCVCIYLYTYPSLWREREGGVSVAQLLDKLLQQHIENFHRNKISYTFAGWLAGHDLWGR